MNENELEMVNGAGAFSDLMKGMKDVCVSLGHLAYEIATVTVR